MNTDVSVAYRQGRFIEAAVALDRLPFLDDEHAVTKVEIAYFLGHLDDAIRLIHRYLKSITVSSLRWRLLSVQASIKWDEGDLSESIGCTQQAYQVAVDSGQATAIARSAVPLLERTCSVSAYDSALPLSALARRATFRSGDAQVLALLEPLTDDDLAKPYAHYLPDEPGEGVGPAAMRVVYGNTTYHYREHQEWIEEMLKA